MGYIKKYIYKLFWGASFKVYTHIQLLSSFAA